MRFKDLVANYSGQIWTGIINIFALPYFVNSLGLEQYALLGIFFLMQAWLPLLDLGLGQTLTREYVNHRNDTTEASYLNDLLRTSEFILLCFAIAFSLVSFVVTPFIANSILINNPTLEYHSLLRFLRLASLCLSLRSFELLYRGVLYGIGKHVPINIYQIIRSSLSTFGAIFFFHLTSATSLSFITWQLSLSFFASIFLCSFAYFSAKLKFFIGVFRFKQISIFRQFSFGLGLLGFIGLLLSQVDKIILIRLVDLDTFAIYSVAFSLASSLSLLFSPVSVTFFPLFCKYVSVRRRKQLVSTFHFSSQLTTVLACSFGIFLVFNSFEILYLWTGDSLVATRGSFPLQLLVSSVVLNSFVLLPYQMQLAYGWTRLTLRLNFILLLLFIPLCFVLTDQFGMIGSAGSSLFLNGLLLVLTSYFMFNKILTSERFIWLRSDLLYPFISVFVSMTIFTFILKLFSTTPSPLWLGLSVGVGLFSGFACAGLSRQFLRRNSRSDLRFH